MIFKNSARISGAQKNRLIQSALSVRKNAYCPYSRYAVGASVLTASGRIYSGCNVENSSYGLSLCAERTAIFNAVAAGDKKIRALCVATRSPKPCGACRQVLMEFASQGSPVLLVDASLKSPHSNVLETTAAHLLPWAFVFNQRNK
jgi:cytidine deaminase